MLTEVCGDGLVPLVATIANLDLVITADTLAAHLAGAMDCPAWVMLQHAADWRWMMDRSDSPWYPTLRFILIPPALRCPLFPHQSLSLLRANLASSDRTCFTTPAHPPLLRLPKQTGTEALFEFLEGRASGEAQVGGIPGDVYGLQVVCVACSRRRARVMGVSMS